MVLPDSLDEDEDGGDGGGSFGMTGGNNLGTPEASGQADNSGTGEKVAA